MREIIETLFYEWRERELPETIERDLELERYLDNDLLIVIKGFRRVGKTYLLYHLIKKLLKTYGKNQVVYINFEDERIPLKKELLSSLLPTIKEITGQAPRYLFLDEIQIIPEWSRWLRRVLDTEKTKIFITGSSSKVSEREIPTELRGRYLEIELFPLSFAEFLRFNNESKVDSPLTENQKALYLNYFHEYMNDGGMPAVVLADKSIRRELILNYYNTLLRRDLIEKYRMRNEESLKDLLKLLLNSTYFTATRLFNNLKSIGHRIGKSTILKYISYIEDSFFMDQIPEFSTKIKTQLQRERKIYFIDNGFINLLIPRLRFKEGRLFENMVFRHLRGTLKNVDIFYFRGEKGEEVDFVLVNDGKKMIQAAYDLSLPATRERETRALIKGAKKLGIRHGDIITLDSEGEETASWFGHTIRFRMIPAWKFFLQ